MPTLKEIANSYNENFDFDMRKTAEECGGDMDALLCGSAPSPLLDRAKQLDKIAHSVASLDRSELFHTQLKSEKTNDEVVQSIKTASEKVEPKVAKTEKVAQLSTEAIETVLNKYAQFEEGQAIIKKAYDLGQNMAILQIQDVEKNAGEGGAGFAGRMIKAPFKWIVGDTVGQKGLSRLGGAIAGGVTGAAATKDKKNTLRNAATGAVLGGAGGHLFGEALEHPEIAALLAKGKK